MRVTNQMMYADVLANLQAHGKKLARLQVEAGDGKKLHMPSDNFVAMGDALTLRGAIQSNQTYLNNISTAREFLSASASAMDGPLRASGGDGRAVDGRAAARVGGHAGCVYAAAKYGVAGAVNNEGAERIGGAHSAAEAHIAAAGADGEAIGTARLP